MRNTAINLVIFFVLFILTVPETSIDNFGNEYLALISAIGIIYNLAVFLIKSEKIDL